MRTLLPPAPSTLEAELFPSLDRMRDPRRPQPAPRLRDVRSSPLVEGSWTIEDHLCLLCLGRIASSGAEAATREFRCTNCGTTAAGLVVGPGGRHPPICCCTARYGSRDAGLRCEINPDRGPANPAEIIVREMP